MQWMRIGGYTFKNQHKNVFEAILDLEMKSILEIF